MPQIGEAGSTLRNKRKRSGMGERGRDKKGGGEMEEKKGRKVHV